MTSNSLLADHPNLHAFLPVLYTVWADAVLTPTEVSTLQEVISDINELSVAEKSWLLDQLNPTTPPSPDAFRGWLEEIRLINDQRNLAGMGVALAIRSGTDPSDPALAVIAKAIHKIESTLGIIENEAGFLFSPELRRTITAQQETRKSFDEIKLAALLDGPEAEILRKVKTILSDPQFNYVDTDQLSVYRDQVLQWCQLLANQGFGAMAYPKAYGGKDDMASYFAIMEGLSYHDLSMVIKFGVQFGLFGMSIYFLGTEKHHQAYLRQIGTLELPGCFAMTETGHGSNVRGIETTATYNHARRCFVIHTPNEMAQKEYIGNAACHGQKATVFAKLILDGKDYGVSAFVVPLRNKQGVIHPGVTIIDCGRKMGLNGVDNGKIRFNQVEINYDDLLDRFCSVSSEGKFNSPISSDNRRFFTMLGTLVGGRIGIPRAGLSATKSGLTIAIRYGDKRLQFGPEGGNEIPILNYRTHQRRLMPRLANAYALHFSLRYLTTRFINRTESDMQEIESLAAGLKAFATWNTTETLQECRESCGGKGFLAENRINSLKNDSDIFTTFEGDNTVLMQLVAKSRLGEFKHEFGNMNWRGMLGYVADQARTSLSETNPIVIRNTDDEHLLDSEFHLNAFRYRERDILTSAAKRLRRLIHDGMDSFDAFNVSQHHLVQVGYAYVERIILEQFQKQVKATEDDGCRKILERLCQLFALSQIEKNKGWYLEQGYLEGVKTKAIRKMVNQICWEIRADAVPLVDAFRIPDSCLAAPIAIHRS